MIVTSGQQPPLPLPRYHRRSNRVQLGQGYPQYVDVAVQAGQVYHFVLAAHEPPTRRGITTAGAGAPEASEERLASAYHAGCSGPIYIAQ